MVRKELKRENWNSFHEKHGTKEKTEDGCCSQPTLCCATDLFSDFFTFRRPAQNPTVSVSSGKRGGSLTPKKGQRGARPHRQGNLSIEEFSKMI